MGKLEGKNPLEAFHGRNMGKNLVRIFTNTVIDSCLACFLQSPEHNFNKFSYIFYFSVLHIHLWHIPVFSLFLQFFFQRRTKQRPPSVLGLSRERDAAGAVFAKAGRTQHTNNQATMANERARRKSHLFFEF